MNLIIGKVVRNVLVSIIGIDACTIRNIALMAVFLTPETGNQVDLSILKFGTQSLASRNLRRNRSDESGHRKSPPNASQI